MLEYYKSHNNYERYNVYHISYLSKRVAHFVFNQVSKSSVPVKVNVEILEFCRYGTAQLVLLNLDQSSIVPCVSLKVGDRLLEVQWCHISDVSLQGNAVHVAMISLQTGDHFIEDACLLLSSKARD